jgi:L-Ala-D/L-Glu epimerase
VSIARSRITSYTLPLLRDWSGGGSGFSARHGWLLELEDTNGNTGYGDCAPLPAHGTEQPPAAHAALTSTLSRLNGLTPEQALEQLPEATATPAARCALESALLDLLSRRQGIPMHRWLQPESGNRIRTNASLGALDDGLSERATKAIGHGYKTLKLKLGATDPQQEIPLLLELCSSLPGTVQLRLDANRAWDMTTAESMLKQMQGLPIESLEEPLSKPDLERLKQLQETTPITLALDESCRNLQTTDLHRLSPLRRIILKPMVLGGLTPCLLLGQRAQQLGIEAVVTTTVDSAAGVWAATQLAAALDAGGRLCHGLGTGEWLQRDLGTAPEIRQGEITIPATPGLGFSPYP